MKSRTFSSEFVRQEFKRQLWLMALFAVLFLLVFPIRWVMQLDNLTYRMVYNLQELRNLFVDRNASSEMVSASVIFAAVLGAVYHFAYLHSEKQVDFFGSFPIRREKLFLHKVVFGSIDFVIPYTVAWGIVLILGATRNLVTGKTLLVLLAAWAADQICFLLVYLTTALAMILTGKLVLGILGSGVLLFFGSFAQMIFSAYISGFFDTYVAPYNSLGTSYLSPVYYGNALKLYLHQIYHGSQSVIGKESFLMLMGVAVIAGLFFLNRYLIKKRAGEAAGSSMAFAIPARVIHVALSVSGALWIGLIIKDMMYHRQNFWTLISVFFGAVFFYSFIQFIYTMDFRKVLKVKWLLLVVEILSMGIACVFCFDLIGYDAYMPGLEKTEKISLSIQNYYMDGGYTIDGEYLNVEEYRLRNMQIEQQDMVYEMIENLIAEQNEPENQTYHTLRVRYTLDSGRTVDRCYRIDYNEYEQELIRLFDDRGFREMMYPYLGELGDAPADVWLGYAGESHELLSKDDVTVEEFLQIYRQEIRDLPGSVMVEEIPLAYLEIQTREVKNCFYMYLYPSCEKSLAYLEKLGWQVEPLLTAERVSKIMIEDYRSFDDDSASDDDSAAGDGVVTAETKEASVEMEAKETVFTYTDQAEMEQILPVLIDADYTEVWHESQDNMYGVATVESPNGYTVAVRCELKAGELPEILERRANK